MNRIAFIFGENSLYWSSILLTIAAAVAVCVFWALYLRREGSGFAGPAVVPLAIVLSLYLSRLIHWYCRADSYISFQAAMGDLSSGGFALMGVFAGCFLAALLLQLLGVTKNLPGMLDCMSIAGAAGIAVGRLSSFFDASSRGPVVERIRVLPWVYPVVNPVSGMEENRLATFVIQAIISALIFYLLLTMYLDERKKGKKKDGDICLLFLMSHGAAQVILDSTRYDSLFFRSNGFVSIVQVLGALGIGLGLIVFSVRLVRRRGWNGWYLALWLAAAVLLGLGGYMEYHVQRHAADMMFAYSIMSGCLVGLVVLGVWIRWLANSGQHGRNADEE